MVTYPLQSISVEEAMQHASRFIKKDARKEDPAEEIPQDKDDDNENIRISLIREDIRTYIGKNYQNDISMQSAAQVMGYSEAYFCKLFKQCLKVNFSAWLNEFRVEKAKEQLATTRLSVREVSLACGYADANYFARVFKRVTGMTPSEYRANG